MGKKKFYFWGQNYSLLQFLTFLHIISRCLSARKSHQTQLTLAARASSFPKATLLPEWGCLSKGTKGWWKVLYARRPPTHLKKTPTHLYSNVAKKLVFQRAQQNHLRLQSSHGNNSHFFFFPPLCLKDGPTSKFLSYPEKHPPVRLGEVKDSIIFFKCWATHWMSMDNCKCTVLCGNWRARTGLAGADMCLPWA